jgi:hypothetical protein
MAQHASAQRTSTTTITQRDDQGDGQQTTRQAPRPPRTMLGTIAVNWK